MNGFSFLVWDPSARSVLRRVEEAFPCALVNPEDIQEILAAARRTYAEWSFGYDRVGLLYSSVKYTLFPEAFYKPETAAALLRQAHPLDELDEVHSVLLPDEAAVCLFSVPAPITHEMIQGNREVRFTHTVIPMYEFLRNREDHSRAFLYYGGPYAHLCLMDGKRLLLLNSYETDGFQTALYFLFLALKQFQMNARKLSLYLCGACTPQDVETVKRYIPVVRRLDPATLEVLACEL